ncbi:MAG: U32 family peptidase [Chitinispirillaceae bacterium]|nr:U32 family peptidase [Chitinispirillaceae bacterium]
MYFSYSLMTDTSRPTPIELLAPGGDADCVKAAILAGADAVYCGLPTFNARQRADNIPRRQLRDLTLLAHRHGCRIYLTLNTLVLESEFAELLDILNDVCAMGIDAVIVQDVGLLFFLKRRFPGLEVHASTQMTTHNAGQIAFLSALDVSQVNLCRELSLPEIKALTDIAKTADIRTEVFVHGAYCISFSGQCYMSSAISGHSGNRGACVQPCRRTYQICGRPDIALPFNLRDNSAFSSAGALCDAGVAAFKIEGRIKGATYVSTTVTAWRQQIDRYLAGKKVLNDDPALHAVFNRQFSDGYLRGSIDARMFIDSSRDQSLAQLSPIAGYHADQKTLTLEKEPHLPDGSEVVIYTPDFRFICTGVMEQKLAPRRYRFRIEHELKGKINAGHILYALGDAGKRDELKRRIDQLKVKKEPLTVIFRGSEGQPLEATFIAGERSATVRSGTLLTRARSAALTGSVIAEKMAMPGNTAFWLESIDCSGVDKGMFLPVKELNELRRSGLAALEGDQPNIVSIPEVPDPMPAPARQVVPRLACLIASAEDLCLTSVSGVTLLHEVPVAMGGRIDSLAGMFREHPGLVPWFGPILIGDDFTDAITLLDRIRPPRIVTDNSGIGMEAAKRKIPWIAGPLLNCANAHALRCLREIAGAAGAFLSQELSREQISDIASSGTGEIETWFTVFNPLLLMNTRQCIIRNIGGCDKEETDRACLVNCSKKATVTDANRNPFFIIKKAGHYTQVYNGRHYLNLDIIADIPGFFSTFVVDLRSIATQTSVGATKEKLLELFADALRQDRGSLNRLRAEIKTTTAGQYARGLS